MDRPNRKRRWATRAAILAVLLVGYGTYRAIRPDPNLKKVQQIRQEFASDAAKAWTPDERKQKGQEMRTAMENLSPAQRNDLFAEGQQRFQKEMENYSQMSAEEKTRYLDEQINRMEKGRKAANGAGPPPGAGTFAAGPPGGPGRGPMSSQDRENRRREMLDRTTPEFRAQMDQFRKDMENRRRQRGLPGMPR